MNRVHRLTERDLNRLIKGVINEIGGGRLGSQMADAARQMNLPDCVDYIQRNAKVTSKAPGSPRMLTNVNVEHFTDGGPGNEAIFIHVNGRRACKMR